MVCSGAAGRATAAAEIKAAVTAAVAAHPAHAAFLTMCDEHCGQWGAGQAPSAWHPTAAADYNVSIDGHAAHGAVAQWYAEVLAATPRGRVWLQEAAYPCQTCCSGGG
jgi:hypothetical protein